MVGRVSGFSGPQEQHGNGAGTLRPGFDPHSRPEGSLTMPLIYLHLTSGLHKQPPQGDGRSGLQNTPCGVAVSCGTEVGKEL